jgi:hypothetical protein
MEFQLAFEMELQLSFDGKKCPNDEYCTPDDFVVYVMEPNVFLTIPFVVNLRKRSRIQKEKNFL